jgi:hypothetical protein
MVNVHGVDFAANQSELVEGIVRELLKEGGCAVCALPTMKPHGELQMTMASPEPGPGRQSGVFPRIRPGLNEATILRPAHTRTGENISKLNKLSRREVLQMVRTWRQEVAVEEKVTGMSTGMSLVQQH